MSGYSSVFWFSLCASLTALGLVLSVLVGRRRGLRSMLRGAAWSLIPLAAYMTGSTQMFWRIGVAIGNFASSFVFQPLRWAGIAVAGVVVLLFLVSGSRERRRAARAARAAKISRRQQEGSQRAGSQRAAGTPGGATLPLPATRSPELPGTGLPAAGKPERTRADLPAQEPARTRRRKSGPAPGADNDLSDVEEILRKRGILSALNSAE